MNLAYVVPALIAPTVLYRDSGTLHPNGLTSYFDNPALSDISVVLPNQRVVRCHQVVLCSTSQRMAALLSTGTFTHHELPLAGADADALLSVLRFLYTGEVELAANTAVALYDAANKLEVPSLCTAILQYLTGVMQPSSVPTFLDQALACCQAPVADSVLSFFSSRLSEVVTCAEFPGLSENGLARLLSHLAPWRPLQELLDVANAWCNSDGQRLSVAQRLLAMHMPRAGGDMPAENHVTTPPQQPVTQLANNMAMTHHKQQQPANNMVMTRQHQQPQPANNNIGMQSAMMPAAQTSSQGVMPAANQPRTSGMGCGFLAENQAGMGGAVVHSGSAMTASQAGMGHAGQAASVAQQVISISNADQAGALAALLSGNLPPEQANAILLQLAGRVNAEQGVQLLAGQAVQLPSGQVLQLPAGQIAGQPVQLTAGQAVQMTAGHTVQLTADQAVQLPLGQGVQGGCRIAGQAQFSTNHVANMTTHVISGTGNGPTVIFARPACAADQVPPQGNNYPAFTQPAQANGLVSSGSMPVTAPVAVRAASEQLGLDQQQLPREQHKVKLQRPSDDSRTSTADGLNSGAEGRQTGRADCGKQSPGNTYAGDSSARKGCSSHDGEPETLHGHLQAQLLHGKTGTGTGAGEESPAKLSVGRGAAPRMESREVRPNGMPGATTGKGVCSIDNCCADLTNLREYHQRFRICDYHLKISSILRDGVAQRFCQQCGRFHDLNEFDGNKRSCRARLQRHNARRRKRGDVTEDAQAGSGGGGASGGASDQQAGGSGGGSDGVRWALEQPQRLAGDDLEPQALYKQQKRVRVDGGSCAGAAGSANTSAATASSSEDTLGSPRDHMACNGSPTTHVTTVSNGLVGPSKHGSAHDSGILHAQTSVAHNKMTTVTWITPKAAADMDTSMLQ